MNNKAGRVEKWIGFSIMLGTYPPLSPDAKIYEIFDGYENAQSHISIGSFFNIRKHYCSDRLKQ
jgi:hypothetical protein